ncbi:DUF7910 domain-containing protein [Leifsonia sp. RAF41]|uniref:DUF7910 domain-containing protein n=1 Tax=Leifsonia sp. RAF41 TaxID=3233056 RepID=UPI003F94798A
MPALAAGAVIVGALLPVTGGGQAHALDLSGPVYSWTAQGVVKAFADGTKTVVTPPLAQSPLAVDYNQNVYAIQGSDLWKYPSRGGSEKISTGLAGDRGGIALDLEGNIYVADGWKKRVQKITREGAQSTVATYRDVQDAIAVTPAGDIFTVNYDTGAVTKTTATGAQSAVPLPDGGVARGIAADLDGNIYVGDRAHFRISKIVPSGVVSTLSQVSPTADLLGVTVDIHRTVYVADEGKKQIIEIAPDSSTRALPGLWEGTNRIATVTATWNALSVVSLKNITSGHYVTAENGGASTLVANRTAIGPWEKFTLIFNEDNTVSLKSWANGRYVTADNAGANTLIANRSTIGTAEKFTLTWNSDGTHSLRSVLNGRYVKSPGIGELTANGTTTGSDTKFALTWH